MFPLARRQAGPPDWLPPGSVSPDNGPSSVVFPPQKLTIRFNHKKHIKEAGANCMTCHSKGQDQPRRGRRPHPPGTTCDACHDTDHTDLKAVKGGSGRDGQMPVFATSATAP